MRVNEGLRLGGPHAESYGVLLGMVRSQRVQSGLFNWLAQQMGRVTNTVSISDHIESKARSNIAGQVSNYDDEMDVYDGTAYDPDELEYLVNKIPNLDYKLATDLLSFFGSIDNLRSADYKEIMQVKGIKKKLAQQIIEILEFDSA